jgi:hypothetical protein
LNLGKQETRSVRLFAGVVAQSAFVLADGTVQPQLMAGWSRELLNDPSVIR